LVNIVESPRASPSCMTIPAGITMLLTGSLSPKRFVGLLMLFAASQAPFCLGGDRSMLWHLQIGLRILLHFLSHVFMSFLSIFRAKCLEHSSNAQVWVRLHEASCFSELSGVSNTRHKRGLEHFFVVLED